MRNVQQSQGIMPEVATYQYNTETGMLGYTCIVCGFYWKNLAAPMHVTESQIQAKKLEPLGQELEKDIGEDLDEATNA